MIIVNFVPYLGLSGVSAVIGSIAVGTVVGSIAVGNLDCQRWKIAIGIVRVLERVILK